MRIEPLLLLDVVTCEDDHVPSARVLGAPLLESEAVHAEGDLLGREGALHCAAVNEYQGLLKEEGREKSACSPNETLFNNLCQHPLAGFAFASRNMPKGVGRFFLNIATTY